MNNTISDIKARRGPGLLVKTRSGKKARTFHEDEPINGKLPVYPIDDEFRLTGERLLCKPENLQSYGHID